MLSCHIFALISVHTFAAFTEGVNVSLMTVAEDTPLSPFKPSVPQHYLIDDLEKPLLTSCISSSASVNHSAPNADPLFEEYRQRHTQWLLLFTTAVITIAVCQTDSMLEANFVGLLMASLGFIWLQMQPDMQVGSAPLTKVNAHSTCIVLWFAFVKALHMLVAH